MESLINADASCGKKMENFPVTHQVKLTLPILCNLNANLIDLFTLPL